MPVVRVLGTLLAVGCLAGLLSACGSSSRGGGGAGVAQRGAYKVGAPYKIDGVTYTPQEEFNRTETGVASWYGPGFHGKSTANGERYDQGDRTAAHRTLQMPAIVRVTNLDNGMSTVVRINDRGPFARSRIIDLSRTAAQELDVVRNGTARVRIDQLPAESMAVRDVAIAGGGPAEQNAAVAQVASGQRTAPAPTMAAAPPPPAQVAPAPQPQLQPVVVPPQPAPQPQPVWPTTPQPPSVETPVAQGGRAGGVTVASLATGARTGGGTDICACRQRLLCADRGLLDDGKRRAPARRGAQLRRLGGFPGIGRRTRRLAGAVGALFDRGCCRHRRGQAEAIWLWRRPCRV